MDIFMMSSEFEGLPIALLEAMSMNCVPVSTAAGGIPEVIKDGVNGLLVPVEQPLQLVDRLSQLLQQPGEVARMKQAARETVINSFSMKKMVAELEDIYTDLINK
jgi:glycosyltransferase involved in cell wall biosynthesis